MSDIVYLYFRWAPRKNTLCNWPPRINVLINKINRKPMYTFHRLCILAVLDFNSHVRQQITPADIIHTNFLRIL